MHFLPGFDSENPKCAIGFAHEQFIKQHMQNETIFVIKRVTTGCLDAHLAKNLFSYKHLFLFLQFTVRLL